MKVDKASCQRQHFKKRMLQRFGIKINRIAYIELINLVQGLVSSVSLVDDRGTLVNLCVDHQSWYKQTNRILVVHLVDAKNSFRIPVVYDNQRKTLVTTHEAL